MKTELGQFRFASPIIDLANVNTPFNHLDRNIPSDAQMDFLVVVCARSST
jgi:hypothetical protein